MLNKQKLKLVAQQQYVLYFCPNLDTGVCSAGMRRLFYVSPDPQAKDVARVEPFF